MLLSSFASLLALPALALAGSHDKFLNRNHDALAKRAPGEVELHRRFSNSKWTFYDTQTGNAGACGRFMTNSQFAVALNVHQFGGGYPGPNCFKTITLSYGGKTADAVILDMCPSCPYGGLDLTPQLFAFFDNRDKGIIFGEWNFKGSGGGGGGNPAPTTTRTTTRTTRTTTRTTSRTTTRTTTRRTSTRTTTSTQAETTTTTSTRAALTPATTARRRCRAPARK